MIVYRFAHPDYADDLSGTGAMLYGGRWNKQGVPAVYASWSISLALLEVVANAYALERLRPMQLVKINVPDEFPIVEINAAQMQKKWWNDFEYTQWLGSEVMESKSPLMIKCPSAIVNSEYNYIVNPANRQFNKISHTIVNEFRLDERLFKFA